MTRMQSYANKLFETDPKRYWHRSIIVLEHLIEEGCDLEDELADAQQQLALIYEKELERR